MAGQFTKATNLQLKNEEEEEENEIWHRMVFLFLLTVSSLNQM